MCEHWFALDRLAGKDFVVAVIALGADLEEGWHLKYKARTDTDCQSRLEWM